MLPLRLGLALLTLIFVLLSLFSTGIHFLEGTVIVCALLFQILDIKKDSDEIKELEAQIEALTN